MHALTKLLIPTVLRYYATTLLRYYQLSEKNKQFSNRAKTRTQTIDNNNPRALLIKINLTAASYDYLLSVGRAICSCIF